MDIHILSNKYILNCDSALNPIYRISPFSTKDIEFNSQIDYSDEIDAYFNSKYKNKKIFYTESGRKAINIVLSSLNLKKDDCVTILTTTNNHYVSGCITQEIEKFCSWSRRVNNYTKVIFVNHEFGFPYEDLYHLKALDIPIIEDCAHSFCSDNTEKSVGKVGDFIIYSFPKFFPIQTGGLIVCDEKHDIRNDIDRELEAYIKKVLSHYIYHIKMWVDQRRDNYKQLSYLFSQLNMNPRFELKQEITPGVFLFTIPQWADENTLKAFLLSNGVQCSVLYKEKTMFIPVHHGLNEFDMNFFYELVKYHLFGR